MPANKRAIAAMRRRIQRIAFDANLFDQGLADYPHAENCSRERKELLAAIAALEGKPVPTKEKPAGTAQQPGLPLM